MLKGKIVQVMGPVVDVEFADNNLPYIKDALEVDNNGKRCVMEVAQVKVFIKVWKLLQQEVVYLFL